VRTLHILLAVLLCLGAPCAGAYEPDTSRMYSVYRTVYLNTADMPAHISLSVMEGTIEDVITQYNAEGFEFSYGGTTNTSCGDWDGVSVICFSASSLAGCDGFAGCAYYIGTEFSIWVSTQIKIQLLTPILLHEIGHGIHLKHTPLGIKSVMHSVLNNGSLFSLLQQDDKDGIRYQYPRIEPITNDEVRLSCVQYGTQFRTATLKVVKEGGKVVRFDVLEAPFRLPPMAGEKCNLFNGMDVNVAVRGESVTLASGRVTNARQHNTTLVLGPAGYSLRVNYSLYISPDD
jgi:hypothetical protein